MVLPQFNRNYLGAFRLAKYLRTKHPELAKPKVSVSPIFRGIVGQYTKIPIKVYFRKPSRTTSACLRGKSGYEIIIPECFNTCHKRFALCKELCHVLTDKHGKSSDPSVPLKKALTCSEEVRNNNFVPFLIDTLHPEDFCFLLALEILIPEAERKPLVTNFKSARAYDIAYSLSIPETFVKFFATSGYYQYAELIKAVPLEDPNSPGE